MARGDPARRVQRCETKRVPCLANTRVKTGRPLELAYGIDGGYKCTWSLDDQLYAFLKRQMDQKAGWNCQVPLSADEHAFKLPFTIPIWGVVRFYRLHFTAC